MDLKACLDLVQKKIRNSELALLTIRRIHRLYYLIFLRGGLVFLLSTYRGALRHNSALESLCASSAYEVFFGIYLALPKSFHLGEMAELVMASG